MADAASTDAETDTFTLPLLPLQSGVVLPQMVVTLALETPEARDAADGASEAGGRLLLVPRTGTGAFAAVGTIGRILPLLLEDTHLQAFNGKETTMLYTIAVLLIVLWLLGLVTSYTIGGFIHILLVIAVISVLIRLIQGRKIV